MPPKYPGQSLFLKAQATKGKDDPEYIEALSESESHPAGKHFMSYGRSE